jgi:hypothetical protein
MEPVIEIISKNILSNNRYDKKLKNEFISTINRITLVKQKIIHLYRSMDYVILYNTLYEEIQYLDKQKKYFNQYLEPNLIDILDEYFNNRIEIYNHCMNKI